MQHITLYRKYRPSSFSEVSGENEIVKTLKLALKNKTMSHAYLFSGPRGVGKTTTARLIAKGVNCLNLGEDGEPCNECRNCKSINEGRFTDLIEIDAASNRSIDEIRSLKEKINYQPAEGLKKVYIIDEAHMLTKEAFNALLKTLEEPPSHVIFILATTELEKILPTIISRCQRYDFKALDIKDMRERLAFILEQENIKIDEEVYPIIHENSSGSMRDSISILERLIISSNKKDISLELAEETLGITPTSRIKIFLDILLNGKEHEIINELEKLDSDSYDLELFFKDLAKYIKNLILKNEIDNLLGLKIISIIFDVLTKFKFEDDKKLIGYVIISDILFSLKNRVVYRNTIVEDVRSSDTSKEGEVEKKEEVKEKINLELNFDEIKNSWDKLKLEAVRKRISYKIFLLDAKPLSLEDGILTIAYNQTNAYAKEQMETVEYSSEFLEIAREFFNEKKLNIQYKILGERLTGNNKENDFHKKIKDFFEGNNI